MTKIHTDIKSWSDFTNVNEGDIYVHGENKKAYYFNGLEWKHLYNMKNTNIQKIRKIKIENYLTESDKTVKP